MSGGERPLLDNASGYVAPGKLTVNRVPERSVTYRVFGVLAQLSITDDVTQCLSSMDRRRSCYWKAVRQRAAPSCGLPAQTLVNHGFV